MKHSFEDDLRKELETLDQSLHPTTIQKVKMKHNVFRAQHTKPIRTHNWLPIITSIIVIFSIGFGMFTFLGSELGLNVDYRPAMEIPIVDTSTPEQLQTIPQPENTFLIDWRYDAMDRGNHDFDTSFHGQLIVNPDIQDLSRGQVVYYPTPTMVTNNNPNTPVDYIGRVVGLPGETVEIKSGQVFINGQLLDTFYGKALMSGMNEEEYFDKVDPNVIANEQNTREYFNLNMPEVTVKENTVFILVDQWWRGTDSRTFGTLPIKEIKGIVMGYNKE